MARSLLSAVSSSLEHTSQSSADVKYDYNSEAKRKQSQIALATRYNAVRTDQSFAWAAVSARQLDDVSEFVVRLWEPGHEQTSTLVNSTRAFAAYVVQELDICETAILASMVYMVRLKDVFAEKELSTLNCSKQLFVVCLLTASKYLYDIPQTNASWARVCQLDSNHINSMELELLDALSFSVGVTLQELDAARLYSRRRMSLPTDTHTSPPNEHVNHQSEYSVLSQTPSHSDYRPPRRYVSFQQERTPAYEASFERPDVPLCGVQSASSFRDAFDSGGHALRDTLWPMTNDTFRRSYSSSVRTGEYYPWASHHTEVHRSKSEGKVGSGVVESTDTNFSLFSYSFDERRETAPIEPERVNSERYETRNTLNRHKSVGAIDLDNTTLLVQRRLQSLGLQDDTRSTLASSWGMNVTPGSDLSGPRSNADLNKSADSMSVLCASDCESVSSMKYPRSVEWWDGYGAGNNRDTYTASSEYQGKGHFSDCDNTKSARLNEDFTGNTMCDVKQVRNFSDAPMSRINDGHVAWRDLRGQLTSVDSGAMLAGDRSCDCEDCDVRYHESKIVTTKCQSLGGCARGDTNYEQSRYLGYEEGREVYTKHSYAMCENKKSLQGKRQSIDRGLVGAVVDGMEVMHRSQSMEPSFSMFSENSEWGRMKSEGAETLQSTLAPSPNMTGQHLHARVERYAAPQYPRGSDNGDSGYARQLDGSSDSLRGGYSNPDYACSKETVAYNSISNRVGGLAAPSYYPAKTVDYEDMCTPTSHVQAPSMWVPMATHAPRVGCAPVCTEAEYVNGEFTASFGPAFDRMPTMQPYGMYLDAKSREYMHGRGPRGVV